METKYNSQVPVVPVRDVVIFPGSTIAIKIKSALSKAAIKTAEKANHEVLIISQKKDGEKSKTLPNNLFRVGTLSRIRKASDDKNNTMVILVSGISRFEISSFELKENILLAQGQNLVDTKDLDVDTEKALVAGIKSIAASILDLLPIGTKDLSQRLEEKDDLGLLTDLCAMNLNISFRNKQELLEFNSLKRRALRLLELMQYYKESIKLQNEIGSKLSEKMAKSQREVILREQLKAIQEELGESGSGNKKDEDYRKKIDDVGMPDDVREIALDELRRLESQGNSSPESHVIRNYLDLICAMPWTQSSKRKIDLNKARKVLESDHYGLNKVKKRIIQHLAVMKLKKEGMGSILLFAGPPGVGKTSLGQSIARALGRKFIRISLGGVRDDAEIRGHRRTYIGAMPGRIIQGIKRAGTKNPVFMLDEIDKLSFGYHGDPASALLEVLDPEQNSTFTDHYLDVPFDLSQVSFIATANSLESIPAPLRDRLEVIELSGYTTNEKLHIAKNHLFPKQLALHGIKPGVLSIDDKALLTMINTYTREAGVRELQRRISAACRASAEKILKLKRGRVAVIQNEDLEVILGTPQYFHEVAEKESSPGVVTGLAWTPLGGEILFIEGCLMPGSGNLTLTGQLGDVMQESARIALSIVRANLSSLASGFRYNDMDIHIHVPAGAIPKDGPSAGVTIITALASLVTGIPVSPRLAMTGEITLRGAVTPVGGIKEKLLAAHRAGIEKVLLPEKNRKDLRDVPTDVRAELNIEFVGSADKVLQSALGIKLLPEDISQLNTTFSDLVGVN